MGIDIEFMRADLATEEIGQRFFSGVELRQLRSIDPEFWKTAFFNCWTRKAAYIKARGQGQFLPPEQFDVSIGPEEPPSLIANRIEPGEPARCSHGHQLRDFLYAANVASAFVRLLDSGVEGAVNVASGIPVSIADLVLAIADAIGRRDLVRLGELPVPHDEPLELVADTRRLRDEVGWQQAIDLRHGLADTIEWWRRALAREPGIAA